ncbi:O-antigen polysaccharide polymerase Wzy [Micromonospora sp. WMMD1274]|uniref:O-antigen polysaccharide polymerase Wzy n=1 Tax=Micromonospora sp. WMMD1274 TaxID=3404116 RepID=UPI003B939933
MELSTSLVVWLSLALGAAMLLAVFLRSGRSDFLPYLFAYFIFFGLGPAINYALGNEIYVGIIPDKIKEACLALLLALAGVAAVALLMPIRERLPDLSVLRAPRKNALVPAALWAMASYAAVILLLRGPAMITGNKLERIQLAGPLHYRYLALEICACSLYFLTRAVPSARLPYWLNFGLYVLYCLATNERDFLFVAFAVAMHILLLQRRRIPPKFGLAGVAFAVAATYLSAVRSGGTLNIGKALNEGSTMFVDTYVMTYGDSSLRLWPGQSYAEALLALLPSALVPDRPMLMNWLVDQWAPGSTSGYGFSLTAEAYLNFGLVGIPFVFAAITLGHRLILLRAGRGHVFAYASILYTVDWMYGFRGESITFLNTLLYGAVFYAVICLGFVRSGTMPAPMHATVRREPTSGSTDTPRQPARTSG